MEKTKQKTLTRKWEWLTKGLEGSGGSSGILLIVIWVYNVSVKTKVTNF